MQGKYNNVPEKYKNGQTYEIDLLELLRFSWLGFKKFWVILLAIMVVFVSVTFAYCKRNYVPVYECKTSFSVLPLVSGDATSGISVYKFNYNPTLAKQLSSTFPHVINSGMLMEIVRRDLGGRANGSVSAVAVNNTNILELKVRSVSADDAYKMIQSVMKNYPRISEIVMGDIKVDIITEPKIPTKPCNENDYLKYMLYAFVGSLGIWAVILILYALMKRTICNKQDVKEKLNQDYLVEIPQVQKSRKRSKDKATNRLKSLLSSRGFKESLNVMKVRTLKIIEENKIKIIGVTGAYESEGKTTIATAYAKTLSSPEKSVLLVQLNLKSDLGIKTQNKNTTLNDLKLLATPNATDNNSNVQKLFQNVDLLLIDDSQKAVDKEEFKKMLAEYAKRYAYIVVDLPPCNTHTDSVAFADMCDAYVFVVRCDYTSVDKIRSALGYLSFSTSTNLGIVLNQVSGFYISYGRYSNYGMYGGYGKSHKYGYAYGYNKYYYNYGNYGEAKKNEHNKE